MTETYETFSGVALISFENQLGKKVSYVKSTGVEKISRNFTGATGGAPWCTPVHPGTPRCTPAGAVRQGVVRVCVTVYILVLTLTES